MQSCVTYCCAPNDIQKDEEVEFYREKFAGSQADRIVKAEAEAEAKKISEKLKETKISGYFLCFFVWSFNLLGRHALLSIGDLLDLFIVAWFC